MQTQTCMRCSSYVVAYAITSMQKHNEGKRGEDAEKQSGYREKVGNGRNTVLRVLFWKRELTEFCGEFCEELGEFASAHK